MSARAAKGEGSGPVPAVERSQSHSVARALHFSAQRDRDFLVAYYYDDFVRLARSVLRGEGARLLIEPNDIANEAAIRMLRLDHIAFTDAAHFLALASRIMRQILIDELRRARAAKRQPPVSEPDWIRLNGPDPEAEQLEKVGYVLERLGRSDPIKAKIIEQRFVAGMTIEEVARACGVSESTVKRHWRGVRTWFLMEIGADGDARLPSAADLARPCRP